MSLHLSENLVPLLADHREADPSVHLGQAVARAEFLLRASRTVATLQYPQRALEALTELVLHELDLVEVAQVAVTTETAVFACCGTAGRPAVSTSTPRAPTSASVMTDAIRRGRREEVLLPRSADGRAAVLRDLLADDDVATTVARSEVGHLVVLPLVARGQPFGHVVLGRGEQQDFAGAEGFLDDLADRVAVGLDALLMLAESRRVTAVLRRSLAPPSTRQVPHLRIATYSREAQQSEHLSGDFVDVFGPDGDLHVLCCDVEGSGVEAAVVAQRIRDAVRTAALVNPDPSFVLGLANQVLLAETEEESTRLATAICARVQSEAGHCRVTMANAGHLPAFLIRVDGDVEELQSQGTALGLEDHSEYDSVTATIGPLDSLLLYTDGVTEARGALDLFGEERLQRLLGHLGGVPARAQVEAVAVAVSEHLADRPQDDITMLALQKRAAGS